MNYADWADSLPPVVRGVLLPPEGCEVFPRFSKHVESGRLTFCS